MRGQARVYRLDSIRFDILMTIFALISVLFLIIEFFFTPSERIKASIFGLDFAISILFAFEFLLRMKSSEDKRTFLKGNGFELLAAIPAYVFFLLESHPVLGVAFRSVRVVRLARLIALASRLRRTELVGGEALASRHLRYAEGEWVRYAFISGVIGTFYLLFTTDISTFPFGDLLNRGILSAFVIAVSWMGAELFSSFYLKRLQDEKVEVVLERFIKAASLGVALVVNVSLFFGGIVVAALSIGLVGLVLSASLSPLLSNLIGWIYIVLRSPYRLGDSVAIGVAHGTVVEIGFLTTTLMETAGGASFPQTMTGRIVTLPNSSALSQVVSSYSLDRTPFILDKISFDLTYESDLKIAGEIASSVTRGYIESMIKEKSIQSATGFSLKYSVPQEPVLNFEPSEGSVRLTIAYPTPPEKSLQSRTELTQRLIEEFNQNQERVRFRTGMKS